MYDMKLAEEAHMEYINDPETFFHMMKLERCWGLNNVSGSLFKESI